MADSIAEQNGKYLFYEKLTAKALGSVWARKG